jgi:hypothetical protein
MKIPGAKGGVAVSNPASAVAVVKTSAALTFLRLALSMPCARDEIPVQRRYLGVRKMAETPAGDPTHETDLPLAGRFSRSHQVVERVKGIRTGDLEIRRFAARITSQIQTVTFRTGGAREVCACPVSIVRSGIVFCKL